MFLQRWWKRFKKQSHKVRQPARPAHKVAFPFVLEPVLETLEQRVLPSQTPSTVPGYGQIPLSFEVNQGQTDPEVRFLSHGSGYGLFLTGTQTVLTLQKPACSSGGARVVDAVHVEFVGANANPQVVGLDEQASKSNYLIGNDPSQWHTNIPSYGKVEYQNLYRGVNLVYYGNQRQLEYDFQVAPGIAPSTIQLSIQGAEGMSLDSNGNLMLHESGGDVIEQAPVMYQDIGGARQSVSGGFVLEGNSHVSFQVGAYDPSQPLVIDPVLSYSTYLGGSGNDTGYELAVDSSGSAYVIGTTDSTNFPTANPLQGAKTGTTAAFITKLNPTGTALVYSSYLGGSGADSGFGIAVDAAGDAYVTGQTSSTDFPTVNPFQSTNKGGNDGFVAELGPAGSALLSSSYLGGSGSDSAVAISVDGSGNAYVLGQTSSTDLPTTASAYQKTYGGGSSDLFIAKINPGGSSLAYLTYLGSSGADTTNSSHIGLDAAGNVYVEGITDSNQFPTTPGAFQTTYGGGPHDAFVTKLNATGSSLVYSTYLGGSGDVASGDIAVDASGAAYVSGWTTAGTFPLVNALFPTFTGTTDAWVAKLKPDGSGLDYSTFLGGSGYQTAGTIGVDAAGNAYVAGLTSSTDVPTANALQTFNAGGNDAFLTKFNQTGSALVYSTYLGGSGNDSAFTLAVDSVGDVYLVGQTTSTDLPTTSGAFQTSLGGQTDTFIAKMVATATHFSVTTSTTATAAGAALQVTVSALDGTNAVATAYTGTVHFTTSDTLAALPADYTFTGVDQGTHTFSVILRSAGKQTLSVTDTSNSSITGEADTLTEFPTDAQANDFLFGITTGPDGNLWFAEYYSNRIGKITTAGVETSYPVPTANSEPALITTGPDGNLWFTEFNANQVAKINPTTGVITEFPVPTAASEPYGITTGPDGNLWFAELAGNKIASINPTTDVITEYATPTANSAPVAIVTGPDGNLWFTEFSGNNIGRINPTTGTITEYSMASPNSGPTGIALGPDGNLWFTEEPTTAQQGEENFANNIGRINPPTGQITEFPVPIADSGLAWITSGPDGGLWFTQQPLVGGAVGRIDPTTGIVDEFSVPTPNNSPGVITVGPDNNLWFTGGTNIDKIVPSMSVSQVHFQVTAPSSVVSGIPFSVTVAALDPAGNVVTNFADTITFSSSDVAAGLPADYTFTGPDKGVRTFYVTDRVVGSQTLTVTDADNGTSIGNSPVTVTKPALNVAGIGANESNQAANQVFSFGDVSGFIDRGLTDAQFDALTTSQLRAAYDVILVTYGSATDLNLDWNTRLLPYLQAGGDVIWEDVNNLPQLEPAVTAQLSYTTGPFAVSAVPQLTSGITSDFTESFTQFTSWDPALTPFLSTTDAVVGLYGQFGTGRIVLTGPANDLRGLRGYSGAAANQYNLLVNEIRWETATADQLTLSAPAVSTAGTAFTVTVKALDRSGNVAAGYTGTVHLTSSDPLAILPNDYTFTAADAGVHTFMVTLRKAGDQTITVADTVSHWISGQTPITAAITEFPLPTANSQPDFIVTGPDGNLWFTEDSGNRIGRITSTGTLTEFTIPTPNSQSRWIVAGPDGNLWFAEQVGQKIGRVTTAGVFTEFAVPNAPDALAAGPDGNLWFTEQAANNIARITPTGSITEFAVPTPNSVLQDIHAGPDGNLWFVEQSANKIGRITPAGVITEYTIPTPASVPLGITAGPDGNLWFNEQGANQIGRITPSGAITEYSIPTAGSLPTYLGAGPDGNIWFGERGANQLGRITPNGTITEFPLPTPNSVVQGITTGPDNRLWFAESSGNKIGQLSFVLTNSPAAVSQFAVNTPVSTTAGTPFNFTVTAEDAFGNIVPSYTGTAHFTSSDPLAVLPADTIFTSADQGVITVSTTLSSPGLQQITVADRSAITGSSSVLLPTVTWSSPSSGDWDTASNWSTGLVPGPSDVVLINQPGVTVTHGVNVTDSILGLVSQDPVVLSSGTLSVASMVQVNNTFTLSGGTLSNATVVAGTTITATSSGGTLDHLTLAGSLDLQTNSGAYANVSDGLTLQGGTIQLGNASGTTYGDLNFYGPAQTIDGSPLNPAFIVLGASGTSGLFSYSTNNVTFGPNLTIEGGQGGYIQSFDGAFFDNRGTISADAQTGTPGTLSLFAVTNDNLIRVADGSSLILDGNSTSASPAWTNNNIIEISGGGTFTLQGSGTPSPAGNTWLNAGTIYETASVVDEGGTFTVTMPGVLIRTGGPGDGRLDLTGTFTNSFGVTLNDGVGSVYLEGGTIVGGTIAVTGTNELYATDVGGALDGVTLVGTLDNPSPLDMQTNDGAYVLVYAGLTLQNARIQVGNQSGTTHGSIYFDGAAQTVAGAALTSPGDIELGGYIGNSLFNYSGSTVTFGSNLTIHGNNGDIAAYNGAFDNQATIIGDPAEGSPSTVNPNLLSTQLVGGSLYFYNLTNDGLIEGINGESLTFDGFNGIVPAWTNNNTIAISSGGTLYLQGSIDIPNTPSWQNNGTISETGSTVDLGGVFTLGALGTLVRQAGPFDGTVNVIGTLINTNLLLDDTTAASTGSWYLQGGTIQGGSVAVVGTAELFATGTGGNLIGVTLAGTPGNPRPLDSQTVDGNSVNIYNGLTLQGATIQLGKADGSTYGQMYLYGNLETVDGASSSQPGLIALGSPNSGIFNFGSYAVNLGANLTVDAKAGVINGIFQQPFYNYGTITADAGTGSPQTVYIGNVLNQNLIQTANGDSIVDDGTWLNNGTLLASGSGTLTAQGTWTNNGSMRATGGGTFVAQGTINNLSSNTLITWELDANSTFRIISSYIVTNAATVILNGQNANFYSDYGTTNALANFTINAAGANFTVENGADVATDPGFINLGNFTVGTGSSFSAPLGFENEGNVTNAGTLSVGQNVPTSGLVGWWHADGNYNDSVGDNTGTPVGALSFVPGELGQAFNDSGSGEAVSLGNTSALQLQSFTIDAWVKRASTSVTSNDENQGGRGPGGLVFSYNQGGYGFGLLDNGSLFLSDIGVSNISSGPLVTDTQWHHVAVTVDSSGNVTFYVDGVGTAPQSYSPGYTFSTTPAIGALGTGPLGNYGNAFYGAIEEVQVWNRALSGTEIQAAMSAGLPAPTSGLVSSYTGDSNANDSAGSNNGSLQGGVSFAPGLVGQAFSFDGSTGSVVVPDSPGLENPDESSPHRPVDPRGCDLRSCEPQFVRERRASRHYVHWAQERGSVECKFPNQR
jgi:streptogramin lyase